VAQPDFINTSATWNFYIVTSEYDDVVKQRITQDNRPVGLMTDKPNFKVWVKSWAEIIRDCENRLKFVQDTLRIEVSAEEIQNRIADLKSSVMRIENINQEEFTDGPATNSPAAAAKPKKVGKPSNESSRSDRP
jgi:hypothetical protein